ncbi:hypothetical protein [Streptomyces hoynatensis]|uniref:Uncharacterized protein n=1 Tax=Streptomyces hoynatensis TaxID=1141874 RepID=A0A3A9YIG6_9ACTN|nr:hypothetical protein [Streptomyces hoynatensis]RKN36683.1 hypothetical protein D7294_29850 [Streptomyces hoynatensis]
MTQYVSTPRTISRSATARRWMVTILNLAAEAIDILNAAAGIGLTTASALRVGPQWAQLTMGDLTLAVFALYGAAQLIRPALTGLATAVDPDLRDGSDLHEAGRLITQIQQDLEDGADPGDVLHELRAAAVPERLAWLLEDLAAARPEETTALLRVMADHLRDIAQATASQQ